MGVRGLLNTLTPNSFAPHRKIFGVELSAPHGKKIFDVELSAPHGKKIFSVASSERLPRYEPIKNKISETVIPIVIWCKFKILKPEACAAQ